MSGFLKWTESQFEKFDTIASKALNIKEDSEDPSMLELESHNSKLREDIRILKSIASTQLRDSQDKYQAHVDLLKTTVQSLENSLKQLTEENMLLKEHLRNTDMKLTRLTKVNEELSANMDKEIDIVEDNNSVEEYQYQVNLLNEKVKRQAALLKAEKLKTVDAVREKNEILEVSELEKKYFETRIGELIQELNKEKEMAIELKEQLESKPKLSISADSQNLVALSEHLQAKQRSIENLLNEKSSLVLMLENEVCFR